MYQAVSHLPCRFRNSLSGEAQRRAIVVDVAERDDREVADKQDDRPRADERDSRRRGRRACSRPLRCARDVAKDRRTRREDVPEDRQHDRRGEQAVRRGQRDADAADPFAKSTPPGDDQGQHDQQETEKVDAARPARKAMARREAGEDMQERRASRARQLAPEYSIQRAVLDGDAPRQQGAEDDQRERSGDTRAGHQRHADDLADDRHVVRMTQVAIRTRRDRRRCRARRSRGTSSADPSETIAHHLSAFAAAKSASAGQRRRRRRARRATAPSAIIASEDRRIRDLHQRDRRRPAVRCRRAPAARARCAPRAAPRSASNPKTSAAVTSRLTA